MPPSPLSAQAPEPRPTVAEQRSASLQSDPSPSPQSPPRPAASAESPRVAALPQLATPPTVSAAGVRYFQDCPTCPWMVRVPGGSFTMGQGSKDPAAIPAHRVNLRPFALGQYPVTVADWKACHAAGGCAPPPRMAVAEDSTPIHNVSWEDAQQYVTWLSRTTGHAYRLPTEAEWEYAARAGTGTRYWWGDQVGVALANCADCGGTQDPRGPMPVDRFQPNGFGLYGMLGGVAQWTQDCWFPNYQGAPTDGSAREARSCMKRVLRGGSFRAGREEITTGTRSNYDAPVRYLTNGFRIARNSD